MPTRDIDGSKLYRLEVGDGNRAPARMIEFTASGAESAIGAVQRHCGGQRVTVFEDGRPLGSLQQTGEHGFWIIAPPPAAR